MAQAHQSAYACVGNKEPKTDPYAPSTSHQYANAEDTCFGVEDKISTKKQPMKPSTSISIPKWRFREHNKKRKAFLPSSRLLRTSSIHHWSEDNVNFGVETSAIEQNVDVNEASSSNERVYILPSSFDEHNLKKLGDENMACRKSGSFCPSQPDELESILQMKQLHLSNILNETEMSYPAQKDTNVKEMQGDVILHPSKEFLAMMKLFNGNMELIQNILDDPSYIFAHYLQAKQASNTELTRACSFPASSQLARTIDGKLRIKHKRLESESLVKHSDRFHSEKSPAHTDIVQDDTPKTEMMDCDERIPPKLVETFIPPEVSILQNVESNLFMTMKQNKKGHHSILMDRNFHKIPVGRKVIEAMKKSKADSRDGSAIERPDGDGSIHDSGNKINKHVKKNIQRFQSLNDSSEKYSHLYDSISKEEFTRLHERTKIKSLGRVFSLPAIKYCLSSKNSQSEAPFSFSKNLTTSLIEKKIEESMDFTPEMDSKDSLIDCGKILVQSSDKKHSESCQISKSLAEHSENGSITQQEEKLLDEAHSYELTKPTLISATISLALGIEQTYPSEHTSFVDNNAVAGPENNEIDLSREKYFPDIDYLDSLHLQIDRNDEAKFNYVREILRRSGFSGSDFHGAWQIEAEGLAYEITEDENDILLEHKFLFDLINEALVEIYQNFMGYFSPWLSPFNTNTRPMPVGNHILEEIWANICWHLKGQPQLGIRLEDIISRNFTKNDGWMNIQYDIEDVELDLECLIMDDLLDDVVLELSILLGSNYFSC